MSMTREEATRVVRAMADADLLRTPGCISQMSPCNCDPCERAKERAAIWLAALDAAATDAPETGESDDFGEFNEQVEADTSLTKVGSVESGLATLGLGILVVAEEIRALAAEMRRRG